MFTVPRDRNIADPACGGVDFICWPSVAAAAIKVYAPQGAGIPGWKDSLIIPTLKRGSLYRVKLTDDGPLLAGEFLRCFQSENRLRDTAISPDGLTFYVATDPGGIAKAVTGSTTTTMADSGAILALTYPLDTPSVPQTEGNAAPSGQDRPQTVDSSPVQDWPGPKADSVTGKTPDAAQPSGQIELPTLPPEQRASGKTIFNGNCAQCHGTTLTNGTMGQPLGGPFVPSRWTRQSVAELSGAGHDRMPPSRPEALPDDSSAAITALSLSVNGFKQSEAALPTDPDALAKMQITLPKK